MAYQAVIGLECHIQLTTRTKMFCGCPAGFGAEPNSSVCPVCLGLPGALPSTNRAAIDSALRLGLALECRIRPESEFARKNYFYPDMPKNYQITQYQRPLCDGGALPVTIDGEERRYALTRIHLEEDTGKSFHPERHGDRRVSRVDFNRAGVPLLELVTQPVFHEPAECAAFLTALRRLVRWLEISGGDMEKGQLRCDANVSLRPVGQSQLGTKTEIKNLNSIKGVEKGLVGEIARQRRALESGDKVEQATLLYDADHDKLAVMRSKESAHDYRYFPEPDLPLLQVGAGWVEEVRGGLPELPWAREARFVSQYQLPTYDAAVLADRRELADYYENVVRLLDPQLGDLKLAKLASNWVMTEVLRNRKGAEAEREPLSPPAPTLAAFLRRVASGALPGPLAKRALTLLMDAAPVAADLDLEQAEADVARLLSAPEFRARSSDEDLVPLVRAVIDENPGPVAQYRAGKQATFGFLVGQVMKKSEGQAVPQRVQELLKAELGAP